MWFFPPIFEFKHENLILLDVENRSSSTTQIGTLNRICKLRTVVIALARSFSPMSVWEPARPLYMHFDWCVGSICRPSRSWCSECWQRIPSNRISTIERAGYTVQNSWPRIMLCLLLSCHHRSQYMKCYVMKITHVWLLISVHHEKNRWAAVQIVYSFPFILMVMHQHLSIKDCPALLCVEHSGIHMRCCSRNECNMIQEFSNSFSRQVGIGMWTDSWYLYIFHLFLSPSLPPPPPFTLLRPWFTGITLVYE